MKSNPPGAAFRMRPPTPTARELERGWVEFVCPQLGALLRLEEETAT